MRACLVGRDQVRMWEECLPEEAGTIFDLMVDGAPQTEIETALKRMDLTAENIFPTKPDKSKS